jgi:hypothetical protein
MNSELREIETTISLSNLKSALETQVLRGHSFIYDHEDVDIVFLNGLPEQIPVKFIIKPQEVNRQVDQTLH